jgi:hypothetical protein
MLLVLEMLVKNTNIGVFKLNFIGAPTIAENNTKIGVFKKNLAGTPTTAEKRN